jgi:hypothetical protein
MKTQVRWTIVIGQRVKRWTRTNNVSRNGSLFAHLTMMKWLWNAHVEKLEKYIMGMGVHIIIEQMGKVDIKT